MAGVEEGVVPLGVAVTPGTFRILRLYSFQLWHLPGHSYKHFKHALGAGGMSDR